MSNAAMLSTTEVAEVLGISCTRVRQYVKDGRLQSKMIGNSYAFHRDDVMKIKKSPRKHGRPCKG
jgi:excisionase family DNA binding protein